MALIGTLYISITVTDLIRYLSQNDCPKSEDTIKLGPSGQFGESLSRLFVIDHLMTKNESDFDLFLFLFV